jgi:lysophospholipase L1-like esterase
VKSLRLVSSLGIIFLAVCPAGAAEPFELRDGDRVVLVGSTLIEREQRYGYWETALTWRYPDKSIIFRNLGWSGDTVFGDARAGFGTQADGYRQLKEHVLALKPTVIFIGYGTNESFEGKKGLPRFVKGLETLLDDFAPLKARIVLLSPLKQENLGPPLPDPTENNKNLRLYADAIGVVAKKRGHRFVDLYDLLSKEKRPLTDNGIHLTPYGYARSAVLLQTALGFPDGDPINEMSDKREVEKLRQAIIAKNRLYFYRWRPENETYLFGFRKHEQGQNAREIPQFDPLVADKEKEIAKLRVAAARLTKPKAEKKP